MTSGNSNGCAKSFFSTMQARLEKLEAGMYTGATSVSGKGFFVTQKGGTPFSCAEPSPAARSKASTEQVSRLHLYATGIEVHIIFDYLECDQLGRLEQTDERYA